VTVVAGVTFCVVARDVEAADWYVDVDFGNDVSTAGTTAAAPFKSIHYALNQSLLQNGDSIYIGNGEYTNQYDTFPLTCSKSRIKLIGQRENGQFPRIRAYYIDSGSNYVGYNGWFNATPPNPSGQFRYMILANEGWEIRNLVIENPAYKKDDLVNSDYGVVGIGVDKLAYTLESGTFLKIMIENCTIHDNWAGIRIFDDNGHEGSFPAGRQVDVINCEITEHGPLIDTLNVEDEGHQGILLNTWSTLKLKVEGTEFKHNHDGIESGNGVMNESAIEVNGSLFEQNENGFEVAGGAFTVSNCTFRRNEALGTSQGGAAPPTVALGTRGLATTPVVMTVRNCTFDRNQMAVKAGPLTATAYDFGTTASPGNNTFIINPRTPWSDHIISYATVDNVSYVNAYQQHPTVPLSMVGNRWSYLKACSTYNQDVCDVVGDPYNIASTTYLGSFDCFSSKSFSSGASGLNLDAGGVPNKRPLVGQSGSEQTCTTNTPFNYSIAPSAADIVVK
jgi:Right handed beta helix region